MPPKDILDAPVPPPPWGETFQVFKFRMKSEDRWIGYLKIRAAYRLRGLPAEWSRVLAEAHFPPPNVPVLAIKTGVDASLCGLGAVHGGELVVRNTLVQMLGLGSFVRPGEFEGRPPCSFNDAMDWVAENLGIDVVQEDAPSKMAWSVYGWAKENQTEFYRKFLAKRYAPDMVDDSFDPVDDLVAEQEDVGLSNEPAVPDALPGHTDRPAREPEVAEDDELASYARPARTA